ncbi:MAG: HAD family hydrolase [Oscillospiraceae bacterium]|nr:HAD family hydrolase [Oscillospiraceae bacterium]
MRKLLFFDIDGTLCMPGTQPSPRTVATIRAARAKGHKAFLSTGRNLSGVPQAVSAIGFDGYITNAGASAQVGDRMLVDEPLPKELLDRTLALLRENDVCFALQGGDDNYTDTAQNEAVKAKQPSDVLPYIQGFLDIIQLSDWDSHPGAVGYKICFVAPSREHWERIRPMVESDFSVTVFDNLFPNPYIISGELNRHGVDKGKALQAICAYFGQTAEDAIAFGDSTNDSAMIEAAGLGCAMENAQEEVKAIADRICPHCAEDGVARTLEELELC